MPQTDFPRLNAESGYQSNLPLQFTRFFGREEQLAQLSEMLQVRHTRLVTVVNHARRSTIPSPPVRFSRSHASWTASSASSPDPSIRTATVHRYARSRSNAAANSVTLICCSLIFLKETRVGAVR